MTPLKQLIFGYQLQPLARIKYRPWILKRVWWWLRRNAKARYVAFFPLVEFCHLCGVRQPVVWHAPTALWVEVAGSESGVLCPTCFDFATRERRVALLMWTCGDEAPR